MDTFTSIGDNKFKLTYGTSNAKSYDSILESNNDIEEFDIFVEFNSDDDVQKIKKLFQQKGSNVKKLSWSNWSKHVLSSNEVIEMLNSMPNLEFIEFSSWCTKFSGEAAAGSLQLPNLSSIEINECKNFIFDFISTVLPENKLQYLKAHNINEVDAKFNALIKKHPSITRLNISNSDFETLDSLKELKLDNLRCILIERTDETDKQRIFLRELIKSQTGLKSLDLLNEIDHSFNFVDDEIFVDICGLCKLESLLLSVDGISPNIIKSIISITSLKKVELKSNRESALPIFEEFSLLKNSSIESLVLRLRSFEIPAETYSAFAINFENLKSLSMTLGTKHKINFFIKVFPNLKDLNVKFGESTQPVEFSKGYDSSDELRNSKIKSLCLIFWGYEQIDVNKFLMFLKSFKNLEKLEIRSKFPFSANFIEQLADNLNNIKSLNLTSFSVTIQGIFPTKLIDVFKKLRSKLDHVSLTFPSRHATTYLLEIYLKRSFFN